MICCTSPSIRTTTRTARAFLLALRAKGYRPRVVVTDLRRDYGAVIAQVFAQARHHECISHAEQNIRFDQHYQSFCGFESLATAQVYLGVFEKIYRFMPFLDDAQPAIRGKCPLELAGYDLR